MVKIALLTPTFCYFSGIDRVVEQQAIELSGKGNEVLVMALQADIKPKGFKIVVLGMPKPLFLQRIYRLFFFLDAIKIRKAAGMLKGFDKAVSHFYPMNLIASEAKKKFGVAYVYHNHGIGYSKLFGGISERAYMRIFSFFNKISLRKADSAVSISRFMQSELKRETGINSTVVYNRIDRKKFRKGLDGSKIRKKLGLEKKEKMLLFVGRISPHKNVGSLLDIFNAVSAKVPKARLVLIGRPTFQEYYDKLKKCAGKNVVFVNSVDDNELPQWYAACDLYVTASLWEGFNLPAAEAQACGKKVVAFGICSHPEIIKNGVLVKENDNADFSEAIIELLNR